MLPVGFIVDHVRALVYVQIHRGLKGKGIYKTREPNLSFSHLLGTQQLLIVYRTKATCCGPGIQSPSGSGFSPSSRPVGFLPRPLHCSLSTSHSPPVPGTCSHYLLETSILFSNWPTPAYPPRPRLKFSPKTSLCLPRIKLSLL